MAEKTEKTEKAVEKASASPNAVIGNQSVVGTLLTRFENDMIRGLPEHVNVETLRSAVLNSIRKNPKLLKCTQGSFVSALMHCAETGLLPDTPAQECHLIPYGTEANWQAGWRGLIKLARQSGEIKMIIPEVVYKQDEFSWQRGLHPDLVHIPVLDVDDKKDEDITHFYAVAYYTDGATDFEVMTKGQVDKIRSRAKGKNADAWTFHYPEQGRKTVVKRQSKRLPLSPQMARALELDNKAETDGIQDAHPVLEAEFDIDPEKSVTANLADKVAAKAKKTEPEPEPEKPAEQSEEQPETVPEEAPVAPESEPEPAPKDEPQPEKAPEKPPEAEETVPEGVSGREIFEYITKFMYLNVCADRVSELRKKYTMKRLNAYTPQTRAQIMEELVAENESAITQDLPEEKTEETDPPEPTSEPAGEDVST